MGLFLRFIGTILSKNAKSVCVWGERRWKRLKNNETVKITTIFGICKSLCDTLPDLTPFVQFKKREEHLPNRTTQLVINFWF